MNHGMKPFVLTLLPIISNIFSLWDFFKFFVLLNIVAKNRMFIFNTNFTYVLKPDFNCPNIVQNSRDSSYSTDTESQNIVYMQKFLLGGVLLYELHLCEPFFNAKLYALEYMRLNTKGNALLSQVTIFFFSLFYFVIFNNSS